MCVLLGMFGEGRPDILRSHGWGAAIVSYCRECKWVCGKVDELMEPKVLVEMKARGAQASKYKKFKKDVREQIDKGIPLFWSVKLGIASEPEIPQANGYHMRLIIGYNDKKGEIIYTDSWGAGHEFKKMRDDWAWTITKSLFYMKPLSR